MPQPDASQPETTPRRFQWRRLIQYRLRTLLILTMIVTLALGWWTYKARQQRAAVAALKKVGAEVEYNSSLPCACWMKVPPQWPQWLLDSSGVDFFASVQAVKFDNFQRLLLINTTVTDADLECLRGLSSLQKLILVNTSFTDARMKHLEGLTSLQELSLADSQVTDAGMGHLKGLTALQALYLYNTKVSDAGLEHLQAMTALEWLVLENTQVTDAGLERLKTMTGLKRLDLRYTQVTDAGAARLQQSLPNCQIVR